MAERRSSQSVQSADPRSGPAVEPPTVSQRILASGQSTAGQSATNLAPEDRQRETTSDRLLAQRYRLVEKLGAGAMGTVYKALDNKLGRTVAIKILPERSTPDPEAVARFQREARALAKLSHPAIVQAFDEDADEGRHFLVMEYVAGQNLANVLKDKGCLSPTRAAAYAHQIALGLAHAHERGLVHRDLKPGNLLLTPDGDVKILDLGLARFLQDQIGDATLTIEGSGVGTPDYMAPEQFVNARNVDRRADIYSLGCTLYHLIAGRVPFPTSSLTEKYKAHEQHDPTPLEELCPDVPAGLALVVGRMMAKRPEDRFQSAAEAAEALAPYVAGSSQSFQGLKATAIWHGSQLGISVVPQSRRRKRWITAAAAIAASAALLLLVLWRSGLFSGADPSIAAGPGKSPKGGPSAASQARLPDAPPPPAEPDDPNVLTVAQDGRGEYRTIGEALAAAQPRQTIRILDDATYYERLQITRSEQHAGLTLESLRRATVEASGPQAVGLTVSGVPNVTVRGLRLRVGGVRQTLVAVRGTAPGLLLEGLELDATDAADCECLAIYGADHADDAPPAVVQGCTIRGGRSAIGVQALAAFTLQPVPCRRVMVRDNLILNPVAGGIVAAGALEDVQIVGNRIAGSAEQAGIQLQSLQGAQRVLIANNTIQQAALVVWDEEVRGEQIEVTGNLMLNPGMPDLTFLIAGPNDNAPRATGDAQQLRDKWSIHSNWWESVSPVAGGSENSRDVRQASIDVESRVPEHADFLRPAADSPLATGGAGGDLPVYVGALSPQGAEAWDWDQTWKSRHPDKLLTVSQDPQDGGEFRTLGEALRDVQSGMTIRVLDQARYDESLVLRGSQFDRITIESPRGATLGFPLGGRIIFLQDVAGATIRGLRIVAESKSPTPTWCCLLAGNCPGCTLEDLHVSGTPGHFHIGVSLEGITAGGDQPPVVVRNCKFEKIYNGLRFGGRSNDGQPVETRGVMVVSNRFVDTMQALRIEGLVRDVVIAANVFDGATVSGLQLQHAFPETENLLIANNTFLRCLSSIRAWEDKPTGRNIEFANNLSLDRSEWDWFVYHAKHNETSLGPGDGPGTLGVYRLTHNWREDDPAADHAAGWIPASESDVRQAVIELISRQRDSQDFLRPAADSPLSGGGAGGDLPQYVGAVPPEGAEAWDWQKTWTSRYP